MSQYRSAQFPDIGPESGADHRPCEVAVVTGDGQVLVRVSGGIDEAGRHEIRMACEKALQQTEVRFLTIDLSKVDGVPRDFVGTLLVIFDFAMTRAKSVSLRGKAGALLDHLRMMGLDRYASIVTVDGATSAG